jgi:hypothetical protein
MRYYLFLCRLAFVFNLLFVFAAIMTITGLDKTYSSLFAVLLIGYILSLFIINPLANLIVLALILLNKQPHNIVRPWILWFNFIFLIIQISFILLLNDLINY